MTPPPLPEPLPESLRTLRDAWVAALRAPRRRTTVAAGCLVVTAAMFLARMGTTPARAGAVVVLLSMLVAVVTYRALEARAFRDSARILERIVGRVDRERADRAIRALSLLRSGGTHGASATLADLHVTRTLNALPRDGVARRASSLAFYLGVSSLVLGIANMGACAANPWAVFEGADILLARRGLAPVGMAWLVDPQIRARPPEYLHQEERRVLAYEEASLPRGTLLTVRGVPVHAGRRLLLTDGVSEVPFVEDGTGQVVARWPLAGSVTVRVIARFTDVVIPEAQDTPIESVADRAPEVKLEGAPSQVALADRESAADIPLRYEATDDHGLREVHLVLRAGLREERRVLAHLDGETRADRGGYMLHANDPFLRKSHAPIDVCVEAKDNDPITGPKWGTSAAITIAPPDVGEPEARMLEALAGVRGELVDQLAWRLSHSLPTKAAERPEFFDRETRFGRDANTLLESTLSASYAGVRVPGRLAVRLRGRMRKLDDAVATQARMPSTQARASVVKATERMVLVVDAVVRGQGVKHTRGVAKELADVADDLAASAVLAEKPTSIAGGHERMQAAVRVLAGGGRAMQRLGALGRDLGEIVETDLRRVDRAQAASDFPHAVLAAQDLAARLRQPDPSFGARGGRPSHAGGESGGGRGAPDAEEGEGSEVEQAFNQASEELDKLTSEHASHVGKVEQSLEATESQHDKNANPAGEKVRERSPAKSSAALREDGDLESKLAERVRELGKKGRDEDALPAAALEALASAEQAAKEAAEALKQGDVEKGLQRQREAQQKLETAKEALGEGEAAPRGEGESDRNFSPDHASIPKADAHKGPEEFRKRVIKGLGQSSGSRLRDAVKRYAEGLLR